MGQQLRTWRSGGDQRAWLSMLIDTMEQVSRPESRAVPCDGLVLAALLAQLARPATAAIVYGSGYSLRN
ncbi:transcriptional regulator [Bradyrhizobium sp. LjRoot220]|uniref:transcriptional regulator n=1 Tax=Bradyrhizobium sp. LjRoot220 TaxID=3342284 RepID=UPI003ECFBA73